MRARTHRTHESHRSHDSHRSHWVCTADPAGQLNSDPMIRSTTADRVTTITLDRPEKLNAFSGTMREDLLAALREAEGNVVVITGAGRAFCAGGDVERMASLQEANDVERFRKLLDAGR